MKKFVQKFTLYLLTLLVLFEPLLLTYSSQVKAADIQAPYDPLEEQAAEQIDSGSSDAGLGVDGGENTPIENNISVPDTIRNIGVQVSVPNQANGDVISPQDKLVGYVQNPRIVMNNDDAFAVRSLYCLSSIMIDFENDIPGLFNNIPLNLRPSSQDELIKIRIEDRDKWNTLVTAARKNWGVNNKTVILNDLKTLSCLTGFSDNQITDLKEREPNYLNAVVNDTISSLVIDIRVLKTLVYLVTPKNQGGAGHYRIRVQKIRAGYTSEARQYSRESDAVKEMINANKSNPAFEEPDEFDGKTAAEIGMSREVVSTSQDSGSLASATVEDENGDKYEAYLNSIHEDDKNISAHKDGEAIDISEIDDIRCTLIKKRRIGGAKKKKYSVQPIKLAWQTQAGYDASGGNDQNDLGNLFKSLAGDSIRDLVEELGGDITDYEGDLSKGDFSDITNLIGKSLLSEILNSPGGNLSGYDIEDTIQKLGGMYFADFLGLPREIFIGRKIENLDDLQRVIGEAAVEQRLNVPFGTFSGNNLDAMLINMGQRKIEFEMGLDPGGLDGFTKSPNIPLLVGQSLIEQSLGLRKGSFRGNTYAEIKENVGRYKAEALFMDLSYIDNTLHLEKGTTKKFKSGQISPIEFTTLVGKTRLDDTAYGLKYFAAHDSKYNLPQGSWDGALLGKSDSLKNIGVFMTARVFADTDEQRTALTTWIVQNTAKTGDACIIPEKIYQQITVTNADGQAETKTVMISEDKAISIGLINGDLFRLLGCSDSNGRAVFERVGSKILFYAFANYVLNPEEKAKIDLMDTNPELRIQDPEIQFYLTRITRAKDLITRIKSNWQEIKSDPDYQYLMDSLDQILAIVSDPKYQLDSDSAKEASRRISVKIDAMKTRFEARRENNDLLVNKINGTLTDLSELTHIFSEILEGRAIPSSDKIQMDQISASMLSGESSSGGSGSSSVKKINKRMIFLVLSGKINPRDFFVSLGASRVESSLGLPSNSIVYFIQNTERKGMGSKDAFYEAIGQAKIEETFGMPSYYFQGPVLTSTSGMPDFRNNLDALMEAHGLKTDNQDLRNIISGLKVNNPEYYNTMVNEARTSYMTAQAATINPDTNKQQDKDIYDVKKNVEINNLADGIRQPDADILFRMGITGELSSLANNSLVAWANAGTRATQIDQKFGLNNGTTKSLFTGNVSEKVDGRNLIDKNEISILAGKMQISETAIEKLLSAINGNISPAELNASGKGVFYNSSNPYAPDAQPANGVCPIGYTLRDGIKVADGVFERDSFVYVDADGPHSFGSRTDAERYANEHSDRAIDFLMEISMGFNRVSQSFGDVNAIRAKLLDYINNSNTTQLFDDNTYGEIETTSDIPASLLKKIFDRKEIASIVNPLQAYKKAVGQAEAKKIMSWKLFSSFGLNIDPDIFGPDDMYEILNGNYAALSKIGSRLIESNLHLPQGTVHAILNAKTPELRNCAISEVGANILGGLIGLDYISLKGNIFDNVGSSRIEQVLALPRNSFYGGSLDELIKNTSPINFALAFKIPVSDVITPQILSGFFAPDYVSTIQNNSGSFKLQKIKDYLTITNFLPGKAASALDQLNIALLERIAAISDPNAPHWKEGFQVAPDKQEYAAEIKTFLSNVNYLDAAFGLPPGSTKALLTRQSIVVKNEMIKVDTLTPITPDKYREMVAKRTVGLFAAVKLGEALGLDADQSKAVYSLVNNFNNWKDEKLYGNMFTAFSQIFHWNLDHKAGFDKGTFAAILNNPRKTPMILIGQGIKDLDARLNLSTKGAISDSPFSSSPQTFFEVYRSYAADTTECQTSLITPDREKAIAAEKKALQDYIVDNPAAADVETKYEELRRLDLERSDANSSYHTCKKDALKAAEGQSLVVATNVVAVEISHKISELTNGTIQMPAQDIINLTLGGDLRYLTAATVAYGANKILYEDSGSSEIVPVNMRISYADIKLAFFGSEDASAYAADAATYDAIHGIPGGDPDKSYVSYRYGDVCDGKNIFTGCLLNTKFIATVDGLPRNPENLVQGNKDTFTKVYSFDPAKRAEAQAEWTALETNKKICTGEIEGVKPDCEAVMSQYVVVRNSREDAIRASKKAFQEDLQYRTMDAALWKLDKNVYPGFAYAMMKGDGPTRHLALATYIKNGVTRGELFGIKIGEGLADFVSWLKVGSFMNDIIQDQNSETRFDTFVENGGLSFLSGFVTQHSENWLGFSMPAGTVEALALGLSTGEWGWGKTTNTHFDRTDNPQYYKTSKGIQIKTLQEVAQGEVMRRVFAWADKKLGLPVGSSFEMYNAYKKFSEALRLAKALDISKITLTSANLANLSAASKSAMVAAYNSSLPTGAAKIKDVSEIPADKIGDTQKTASTNADASKAAGAAALVTIIITKIFSSQIASAEEALGLVPGTGAIAVGMIVSYLMAVPIDPITIVLFVVLNLFGVYKIEIKCSADGYYPSMEAPTSSSIGDVSGIGVWNGMNPRTMQQKSVQAAQYKARRLILDAIEMQNNAQYSDVIPSQIMTGRDKDVKDLNAVIETNICSKIGMKAVNGICGGDTRAGVWANPQTVAWTHIGY